MSLLSLAAGYNVGCTGKQPSSFKAVFSGCDDTAGNHYIAQLTPSGEVAVRIKVPLRVHGSVFVREINSALFFARRPGNQLYQLDVGSGRLVHTFTNTPDRHFYGHGVVSADGETLFATENNTADLSGVIGVYSLAGSPRKVAEFPSGGIGPHQLALLPDQKTLVVANGGMATHPSSERSVLNLDTMAPNLAYLNIKDGELLELHEPLHHKMSVRHLDVATDGSVVFGVQYQGELNDTVPLVGSHKRGEPIRWFDLPVAMQRRAKQYTASVAIDNAGRYVVVSCPRGNMLGCWDLASGHLIQQLDSPDAAGLYRLPHSGWISSNGYGDVSLLKYADQRLERSAVAHSALRWDNHLTVI